MTSHARPLVAIYPGSFDPPTSGHLDLIARGSQIFDRLVVAVLRNTHKQPLFSVIDRVEMLREAAANVSNLEVDSFEGLLVDYAALRGASIILRGIRTISDYETELQMGLLNRRMRPQTETVFLMASEEFSFVSSRMIREIITLGGDVAKFVPASVAHHIQKRFGAKR